MTVQELAQRLSRWTSHKTLSQMSSDDRLILLDTINAAIFNWYAAAPESMRTTTVSHTLREPETGTVNITAGEVTLPGLALQDYHLGASIMIEGSINMNEIVSVEGTPTVLHEHRTTGSAAYTIYFDTIMITDYLVNRIVSDPRILDTGIMLYRDEDGMRFVGAERRGTFRNSRSNGFMAGLSYGEPYRYIIENTGISTEDEARIMLRVDPIPERVLTLTFDAVMDAVPLKLNDMSGNKKLPIPPQYAVPHILYMALGDLAVSPIWDQAIPATTHIQKAQSIIAMIRSQIQANQGSPRNYVRTTPGF